NTVNSTSIDNLSDAVICAFLASQPNSPQLAREDLEQIDPDDLEEMDLNGVFHQHKNRHFARECRAPKNQENRGREYGRKIVPVENPTENALIAQDGIGGYDLSYQAKEEQPTNFALMALTSSRSFSNSNSKVDSCSKTCLKAYATLKKQYDSLSSEYKKSQFHLLSYKADYDGGFVSFGDGKGRISGNSKIKIRTLDFDDVYFWIKREFSVATTPQQNGVAKRKNRKLIEAARTMLVDSKLPTTFWAEEVNTACYVLNRALVIKPHNKTPYELIHGRPPLINFMKPFGCHVTILNTRDYLGKFDEKSNEGIFIGYSVNDQVTRSELEGLLQQERQTKHTNSTNRFNTISSLVNTGGPSFVNATSPSPFNDVGTLASTNAFEEHPFERFLPFKNVFSFPYVLQKCIFSFKHFVVYQMDVKSVFLYGKIEEEVYVCQPLGFQDPNIPDKVYKVEKALYELHQDPRACQDKYVADILKIFDFSTVKTTSTLIEPDKALAKDAAGEDVDVHLFNSMIGSLMYLTTSWLDITIVVCACARFQVTPKTSHLYAVIMLEQALTGNLQ
nr:ribonuclease H-like domain-containing protein [Tanacetum cinerariifolium]